MCEYYFTIVGTRSHTSIVLWTVDIGLPTVDIVLWTVDIVPWTVDLTQKNALGTARVRFELMILSHIV